MSKFTPRYRDPNGSDDVEAFISFNKAEFYDLVYSAREAEIRYKRLRTKIRNEKDEMDPESYDVRIEDCNESIAHFKSMEVWLRGKYREAFNEEW